MNKAVFLDRDGVINSDEGLYYIYKEEDFKINPGIIESIVLLNKHNFDVIVISNQGGIGKGLYTKDDTDKLHFLLKEKVIKAGGNILEFYYCPHHPDYGMCLCRKPSGLMIEKAIARFSLNKRYCYFIGDSQRDIQAAEKAGIRGILIKKNINIFSICSSIIENKID